MAREKKRTLGSAELSGFCAQVALMLDSGMPLYDGMEALSAMAAKDANAELYRRVSEAVTETGSLYEALRRSESWPKYMTEMVAIGEKTGRLDEVMRGLSEIYEREGRIRRAVVSAVTYPLVLCVMMLLIILVMVLKVLPVFRRLLGSMGIAVNAGGSAMMHVGTTMGWVVLVLVALMVLAVLGVLILLKTDARGRILNALNRFFPPLHKINRKLSGSRVSGVLALMLKSGYPMEDALTMVPNVLDDADAIAHVTSIRQKVDEGVEFSEALSQSGLFEESYDRMIRTGIAAGRCDEVMAKVAHIYEEQVEDAISGLVSIIEPTLVAMLSIVIGAILLSVMLPMAGILSGIF